MQRSAKVYRTNSRSGLGGAIHHRSNTTLILSFLALGVLTIVFSSLSSISEVYFFGLLAYLSGMLATATLLMWIALQAALHYRTEKHDKVFLALLSALKDKDSSPEVRAEAARGLAKLDLEESSRHQKHEDLDNILISTLVGNSEDDAAKVRLEVAKGLTNLELEEHSYYHTHHELDDLLFEHYVE
ncbi:MAG TPA: hypothetical protein VL485_00500 [Ktedonobacteraceae bacterium]|nr:hypothetical protein [Ktedonobacteraceae bacterium]